MKRSMHAFAGALIILSLLCSCKKDAKETPVIAPLNDNSLPSGAVANIRLTAKSTATLEFTLDITVFRDSKNVENQLKAENFSIDTLLQSTIRYSFVRLHVNTQNGNPGTAAPYSALMLMDQSGSILTNDPKDYRLDAAKAFCSNLGTGDNVMLWSFAGSTQQKYGTGFTTTGSSVIPYIESLNGKEGGATPLYKSQYAATTFMATGAPSSNKALMTFTDGDDTEGGYTSQQVADNATARGVKLYNIGLVSAQVQTLSSQAAATGGAFMYAEDARQLISMFGNLGKMLNAQAQYYRTSWKLTRSSGTFTSGSISHKVRIRLPYNKEITVPFSVSF